MTAWTDELVEQMKALHAAGHSCSVIAAEMPGSFTRNAIIGKLHRLGIKNIGSPPIVRKDYNGQKPKPHARGKTRVYKRKGFAFNNGPGIPPTPLPDPDLSRTSGPSLLELTHGMCRWPFGDPQRDGFFFCGDPVAYQSYCAVHAAKAFQPLPERRKARAA